MHDSPETQRWGHKCPYCTRRIWSQFNLEQHVAFKHQREWWDDPNRMPLRNFIIIEYTGPDDLEAK